MAAVIRARAWRVTALVVTMACPQDVIDVGLTPTESITVRRYLDCIDCIIALDSVRALGVRKPDPTVDSLNHGLLYGPGLTVVAAADSVLNIGYGRDSAWRHLHDLSPMPLDRHTYVAQARDRFVHGYQSRGAYGMGWIHTPRAVAHLDSAAKLPGLPPSVKEAVIYARDSLPPPP